MTPHVLPPVIPLAQLPNIPVLITSLHRRLVERQLMPLQTQLQIQAEVDSVDAIREMVISGKWATIMPISVFRGKHAKPNIQISQISGAQLGRLLMLARRMEKREAPARHPILREQRLLWEGAIIPSPKDLTMKMKLSLLCVATGFALMHGAIAASLAEDDARFLRKAGESGMLEIQASKLAVEKSQHPEIRRYAEMMIKDHTAVDEELKALAKSKGFQLPIELEGGPLRKIENLRQLDGPSFDEEYADEIAVDAHEDAVDLFEDAAEDAEDADIKAFAAKHLPALQKHLEMGRELEDLIDDEDDRRERADRSAAKGSAADTTGSVEGKVVVPGTDTKPAPK